MAFVQFSQVSLAFGDRDILKNVTINLQTGSKVALTGANGAGKSTLIKVLAGIVPPDSGSRAVQKDCRIAYLPQIRHPVQKLPVVENMIGLSLFYVLFHVYLYWNQNYCTD